MQYVSPFANLQKQLFGLNELKTFQDHFFFYFSFERRKKGKLSSL